ncbi:Endochitinase 1 [Bulinus truncatus]|nr:Endochitinase 1 [Bulinus truncatus]
MFGAVTLLVLLPFIHYSYGASCERRVCYYTNWSQYRDSPVQFLPEDIDASLCTHLIYAFAKVSDSRLESVEWNDKGRADYNH